MLLRDGEVRYLGRPRGMLLGATGTPVFEEAECHLQPGDRLQLILHRGAKTRDDVADFRFDDDSGLLEWLAPDRAIVTFRDLADVDARQAAVVALVNRWVTA